MFYRLQGQSFYSRKVDQECVFNELECSGMFRNVLEHSGMNGAALGDLSQRSGGTQAKWLGSIPRTPPGMAPTFVVQEVQGAGHVLHDHAGLQLIKVPPLVDVAQDGAWGRAMVAGENAVVTCVSPGHCPVPTTPPHPTQHGQPGFSLTGPKLHPELLCGQKAQTPQAPSDGQDPLTGSPWWP